MIDAKLKFNSLSPLNLKNVQYIVIHHLDASKATPQQIHQWHLDRGWSGAGYNEYIRKDGTVYKLRGDHQGAHTLGYNNKSYGIALEGDFDKENIGRIQLDALVERLKINKDRFPNLKKIVGHRELGSTSCPGKNISMTIISMLVNEKPKVVEPVKVVEPIKHWAQDSFDELKAKGIKISETRFNDPITRGEIFALLNQIVKGK